jgi:hypothetical protein
MAGWPRKGRTWAISRHGGSFHSPIGDRGIYPAMDLRRYIRRRLFRLNAIAIAWQEYFSIHCKDS